MTVTAATSDRRAELLALAASMFAERGLKTTTVRDIADAAGILSGSLYHHFDSKESLLTRSCAWFLDELFGQLPSDRRAEAAALGTGSKPSSSASFQALDRNHAAVAIYQNEARLLADQPRFGYIRERLAEFKTRCDHLLREGVRLWQLHAGPRHRPGLPVLPGHRVGRRALVGVWADRPPSEDVAQQYLRIVLGLDRGAAVGAPFAGQAQPVTAGPSPVRSPSLHKAGWSRLVSERDFESSSGRRYRVRGRVARRLSDDKLIWLTTVGADGTPQPNPVWFLWQSPGTVLVYNRPDANRLTHIAHRPQVALNLDGNGKGGDIVVLTGPPRSHPRLPGGPGADNEAYLAKYAEDMARVSGSTEAFADAYPVAIEVTVGRLRGF